MVFNTKKVEIVYNFYHVCIFQNIFILLIYFAKYWKLLSSVLSTKMVVIVWNVYDVWSIPL